jgi:hypothetical protein
MESANGAYVERQSRWPGQLVSLALLSLMVVLDVICVPLLSMAGPLLRAIGWSSTVLLVTAYRFALARSMVLFYDMDGIGKISEVLPRRRAMWSVKWGDIEHVAFEKRLSARLMRSYPVRVVKRYTANDEIRLLRWWRGDQATCEINRQPIVLVWTEAPEAGA